MKTTMDKLFKGYSITEIEEILLKSAIEDLEMKKRHSFFAIVKKNINNPKLEV